MKQEPYTYLFAKRNQRFRYNIALGLFETCHPAKRTLINKICCKQWGQWQAINPRLSPDLVEALKRELLTRYDTIYSL